MIRINALKPIGRQLVWLAFASFSTCLFGQSPALEGISLQNTTRTQLLANRNWGKPSEFIRCYRGWDLFRYRRPDGTKFTVTLVDEKIMSVDLIPAPAMSSEEVFRRFELGRIIPSHALAVAAQIGPAVSPLWDFTRTTSGAYVFSRFEDERERVVLVRFIPSEQPEGTISPSRTNEASLTNRPRLGISVRTVDALTARQVGGRVGEGLLVTAVASDGAASRAGVRVGDVLLEYDGFTLKDPQQLLSALRANGIQGRHSIELLRGGRHVLVDADFGLTQSDQAAGDPMPTLRPEIPVDLPPPTYLKPDPRRVLEFFGVHAGKTTEGELLGNAKWGTPRDRGWVTTALSIYEFNVNQNVVRATVWNGRVQAIDIDLPDGVTIDQIVDSFRLGKRQREATIPLHARVGAPAGQTLVPWQYDQAQVIVFVEQSGDRTTPRVLRLFGPPPSLEEITGSLQR